MSFRPVAWCMGSIERRRYWRHVRREHPKASSPFGWLTEDLHRLIHDSAMPGGHGPDDPCPTWIDSALWDAGNAQYRGVAHETIEAVVRHALGQGARGEKIAAATRRLASAMCPEDDLGWRLPGCWDVRYAWGEVYLAYLREGMDWSRAADLTQHLIPFEVGTKMRSARVNTGRWRELLDASRGDIWLMEGLGLLVDDASLDHIPAERVVAWANARGCEHALVCARAGLTLEEALDPDLDLDAVAMMGALRSPT